MPHVAKEKLPKSISRGIFNQLFAYTANNKNGKAILIDLYTETEIEMLAKRLATIILLLEGKSLYRIERQLNISRSTAKRFALLLEQKQFRHIEQAFNTRQKRQKFWENLEQVSRAGLPKYGRGRWAWLYAISDSESR